MQPRQIGQFFGMVGLVCHRLYIAGRWPRCPYWIGRREAKEAPETTWRRELAPPLVVLSCRPSWALMTETRKLAAILAADVVGFSRLARADEDRTLASLRTLRRDLIDPTIASHSGRVVKRTGDG